MDLTGKGNQLDVIKALRDRVDAWRGYPLDDPREACPVEGRYEPCADGEHPLTATTLELLRHWFRPEPHEVVGAEGVQYFKYWPHQRRTLETFVYLHEVCRVRRTHDLWKLVGLEPSFVQRDPWAKLGAQLATGSGKTKVMSLIAAWAILNAEREKDPPRPGSPCAHRRAGVVCTRPAAPGLSPRTRARALGVCRRPGDSPVDGA
jgi:hypothetical protein